MADGRWQMTEEEGGKVWYIEKTIKLNQKKNTHPPVGILGNKQI